jgi:oligopeptide transport system ATP-binding protein
VLNQLADIRDATGISYVFISHDLSGINQIADTVIFMFGGKVVESGKTSEILQAVDTSAGFTL